MEDNKDHTIGIVREEKNKWERRVVLTPKEVKVLVDKGIRVLIQPSTNR
jgi:alanine dehydrogenase